MCMEWPLIHTPRRVLPFRRDLLLPAAILVPTRSLDAEGWRGPPAPVPILTLAVISTPPWRWQTRIFRGWKDLVQAVLPPSRYGVAGCQSPQEDKKSPDSQLPSYPRGWPAFVCRSRQKGEERSPEILGLADRAFHNLTPPSSLDTFPAKSYMCLITLSSACSPH